MSKILPMKNGHINDGAKCLLAAALCAMSVFYSGCSQSNPANKLNMGFKPEPGKSFVMRILTEDNISQGQQINISHIKTTELGFDVNGVDDEGIVSIKVTLRAMKEKTTNPSGSFEYDYTNPTSAKETPLAGIYHAMIGESYWIKVTPAGEVAEIDAEDMFGRIAEKMVRTEKTAGDAGQEARNARIEEIKQGVKNYPLTSAEALKEVAGNIISSYPDRPVRTGDSWTGRVDTSRWTNFIPQTDGTYTLKELRQGLALIEVNAEKIITEKPIPESGGLATYTGTVKAQGNMEINEATGLLVHKQTKTHLASEIKERGKTRPMSLESTVAVESVE